MVPFEPTSTSPLIEPEGRSTVPRRSVPLVPAVTVQRGPVGGTTGPASLFALVPLPAPPLHAAIVRAGTASHPHPRHVSTPGSAKRGALWHDRNLRMALL